MQNKQTNERMTSADNQTNGHTNKEKKWHDKRRYNEVNTYFVSRQRKLSELPTGHQQRRETCKFDHIDMDSRLEFPYPDGPNPAKQ